MDWQEKNQIINHIEKIASSAFSSLLERQFLSLFLSEASLEDLCRYPAEHWVQLACRSFQNFSSPHKEKSFVRVYNLSELGEIVEDHGVIDIVYPHLPFLIDSLYATLMAERQRISLFLHLILKVDRSSDGKVVSLEKATSLGVQGLESVLHIQIEKKLSDGEKEKLHGVLSKVIHEVRVAVRDWQPMRGKLQVCLKKEFSENSPLSLIEKSEYADFLKWLDEGFFTFLGYRFYNASSGIAEERLGIAQTHEGTFFGPDEQTERNILNQTWGSSPYFSVTKTMVQSRVHRPVPMDVVRLMSFDEQGVIRGEHQFFGLFTAAVYTSPVQTIPLIQTKITEVLKTSKVQSDWYDGRQLIYILGSLPRDLLFQISVAELAEVSQSILKLKERHKLSLFVLPDPLGHFMWSIIYIPRDRYTEALVMTMGEMLAECYKGTLISHDTHIGGDLSFARVDYIISTDAHPQHKIVCDVSSTELALDDLSLSWAERLEKKSRESNQKNDLDVSKLFSLAYQEQFSVREAFKDIPFIQKALFLSSKTIRIEEDGDVLDIKIFSPLHPLFLSDVFPILENMGLRLLTEATYKIGEGSGSVWLHHWRTESTYRLRDSFEKLYKNFMAVLEHVVCHKGEDDSFNKLVLLGNLGPRHLLLVRAYYRYMRQLGWPFVRGSILSAFERYPSFLKKLGQLFYAQFDPHFNDSNKEILLVEELDSMLMNVGSKEDESILSGFFTLIRATQRTNFFQVDGNGHFKDYVSFKVLPALIEPLSDTKPLYEIFVYAPWVEAIHLRSGKVSRGGIRWSDRRTDYRKEVLELMKAQLVKNAVIVPMGAKGGFYVRTPTDYLSFQERQEVGVHAYKTMICGLLDITDNWIDGKIVPPSLVKRRDQEDYYIVAAADKGTATFSDIANNLSKEYGFWLGDAFASGGSAGYDHKKIGITSRGVWEAVKRHFLELDLSMDKPFTVVGVGDMSGDVFGNGMLLSDKIKLVAAFNHSHIFLDPTPDPKVSYQERKRLFELPRSQWSDYQGDLLSKGGGVFDRKAKSLLLSEESQSLLGIEECEISPDMLIQHILKLPVDLLWFGGIGTYVKDLQETDAEVSDKTNDGVRINGQELKARVVAEGANLAFTQRGRIAYAFKGGKINRDSVDNSAGVDCSDHEVNIKILFQDIIKSGDINEEGRNVLLKEMTEEVTQLILKHNQLQTQAISLIESRGYKALSRQNRLIRLLDSTHRINRDQEALPSEQEIEQRIEKHQGLTRPEIAVLVSHSKLYLYEEILASNLPENPLLHSYLTEYFPKILQERYFSFIENHPLKRELIATSEANFVVNRLGATFFFEMAKRWNRPIPDLIQSFAQIRHAWELKDYWARLDSLADFIPFHLSNELFSLLISFCEKSMERILCGKEGSFPDGKYGVFQESFPKKIDKKEIEKLNSLILNLNPESSLEDFGEFLNCFREVL